MSESIKGILDQSVLIGTDSSCNLSFDSGDKKFIGIASLILQQIASQADSLKWEIAADEDTYQTIFDGHVVRICGDKLTIFDDGLAKISRKIAEKLAKDEPRLTLRVTAIANGGTRWERMTSDEFPDGPKFTIESTLPDSGEQIVAKLEAWIDAKSMTQNSKAIAMTDTTRAALVEELKRVLAAIAGVRR